jgi:hypothetical protein
MADYEDTGSFEDIEALVADCAVVVREDTSITRWDDTGVVLSMGTGEPVYYQIMGEEFQQVFLCLAHPPTFYDRPDLFSVNEWVCIARPGTYWGDVGLVRALSNDEDEDRVAVLLVPRMVDKVNQAAFDAAFVRTGLMVDLWPHTSDDLPLITEDGEETWILGKERMTKEGMVLRTFAPWELRKDMVDGSDLSLLPAQRDHFRRLLPLERWPCMPPVRDLRRHFIRGERVLAAGHNGFLAGWDRSVGPGHPAFPNRRNLVYAEMERIYSETCKGYIMCHPSFIIKQHKEGDTVFSFGVNENVVILECDYLKQEVKIQLRATAARRYKKEALVSRCFKALRSIELSTGTSRASKFPAIPAGSREVGSHTGYGIRAAHRTVPQTAQTG